MRGYDPLVKLAKLYDVKLITKERHVKRSYSVPTHIDKFEVSEITDFTDEIEDSGTAEIIFHSGDGVQPEVIYENEVLKDNKDHALTLSDAPSYHGGFTLDKQVLMVEYCSEDDTFETDTSLMEDEVGFPGSSPVSISREPDFFSPSPSPFQHGTFPKLKLNLSKISDNMESFGTPQAPGSPELPSPDPSIARKLGKKTPPPQEETTNLDAILNRVKKIGTIEEESEEEVEGNLENLMVRLASLGSETDSSRLDFESSPRIDGDYSSPRVTYLPLSATHSFLEKGNLRTLHQSSSFQRRLF